MRLDPSGARPALSASETLRRSERRDHPHRPRPARAGTIGGRGRRRSDGGVAYEKGAPPLADWETILSERRGRGSSAPEAEPATGDDGASLRALLARWSQPDPARSMLGIATSVVPYLAMLVAIYFALRVSVVLALVLSIPAAGFLLRTFIIFHDCAHGAYFRSKRTNGVIGSVLGVILFIPFRSWQHKHAVHHATAGDLDRRGVGDIHTLTVEEYQAKPWWGQLSYWLFRNPIVMFGFGPFWVVIVGRGSSRRRRMRGSGAACSVPTSRSR